MFAAWHTDRSFGHNNRDHVHDKITAQIGGSAFVVVPARSDTGLVVGDLVHEAVLIGDAP